jgi:hypothetical protein
LKADAPGWLFWPLIDNRHFADGGDARQGGRFIIGGMDVSHLRGFPQRDVC